MKSFFADRRRRGPSPSPAKNTPPPPTPSARRKGADGFRGAPRERFIWAPGFSRSPCLPTAGSSIIAARSRTASMVAPLLSASLALATALTGAIRPRGAGKPLGAAYKAAEATGLLGLGFHVYNILKRPGGLSWHNLFYAAPIGAPAALTLAGFFGDCALRIEDSKSEPVTLLGQPAGRLIATVATVGLARNSRRSRPAAFPRRLPQPRDVSARQLAAGVSRASRPRPRRRRSASPMPRSAAGSGPPRRSASRGSGFTPSASRGTWAAWRNASQNLLNGPPLPAPPSFVGLALVGLAALALMEADHE